MASLLALVTLALGATFAFGLLIVGRWAAGIPLGARSFRDSYRPRAGLPPPSLGLALARAAGGVAGWYLAASLLVGCSLFAAGEPRVDQGSMRIVVMRDGPGARGGLHDGDRIVAVDGKPIADWDALRRAVGARTNETIEVDVERGTEKLTLEVKPEGGRPGKIMVGPPTEQASVGLGHATAQGLTTPAKVVLNTVRGIARLLTAGEQPELSGPVGIVEDTASVGRIGAGTTIRFVALLVSYGLGYVVVISLVAAVVSARRRRHAR